MERLIKIFSIFIGLIFITGLNIGLSYLLPFPYSKINIIFAIIILILFWRGSGTIVWLTFFTHLILEFFMTTPFGVVLFSATMTSLIIFWLYQNFFTNRSWYVSILVSLLTISIFRLFYIILLWLLSNLNIIENVSWVLVFTTIWWEIFFTTIFVLIVYLVLTKFSRKFSSAIIESYTFKV